MFHYEFNTGLLEICKSFHSVFIYIFYSLLTYRFYFIFLSLERFRIYCTFRDTDTHLSIQLALKALWVLFKQWDVHYDDLKTNHGPNFCSNFQRQTVIYHPVFFSKCHHLKKNDKAHSDLHLLSYLVRKQLCKSVLIVPSVSLNRRHWGGCHRCPLISAQSNGRFSVPNEGEWWAIDRAQPAVTYTLVLNTLWRIYSAVIW